MSTEQEQKMIDDFIETKRTEEEKITLEFAKAILDCEIQKKEIGENVADIKKEAKLQGVQVNQIMKVVTQLKSAMKMDIVTKGDLETLSDLLIGDPDIKFKLEQLVQ